MQYKNLNNLKKISVPISAFILSLSFSISLVSIPSADAWSSAQTTVSVFGGTLGDYGNSIAVDSSGNIYSTGSFNRTVDFDPGAGTSNLTSAGSDDVFVSKLDSSGNLVWAKSFGGSSSDEGKSIAVDSSGNVYTTGSFNGTVDFDPGAGSTNLASAGSTDVFVSKLDSAGDLVWAKSFGGSSEDYGRSIAVDSSGNVYTTGSYNDTADFDPGAGTSNLNGNNMDDVFVSKLNSVGNFVWAKRFAGISSDVGYSIAVDSSGNVYTTGNFFFTVDFDPGAGSTELTSAGNSDVFVSKLDSSGNFIWAKSFGGSSSHVGFSIAVDGSGNVYTTGFFVSTADFDPGAGTTNLTSIGNADVFVSKLDSAGNLVWAKSFGGTSADIGRSIKVDSSGNVYTTGSFNGTVDFDPGAGSTNLASAGSTDVFVSKLDSAGDLVWAKSFGGSSEDYGRSIAVDSSGNVYTTGSYNDTADFDPGAGTSNLNGNNMDDVFVSKLNSVGNFVWAKRFAGISSDVGYSIAVDSSGNVYTTGNFFFTVDFDPGAGSTELTSAGNSDVFVSKLDSSGNFIWAKSFGGSSSHVGFSIAVDGSGNVYTTGFFVSTADFDPGAGTTNLTSIGNADVFVSKLDSAGNLVWAKSFGGSSSDYGYSTAVDSSGNVYTTGFFAGTVDFDPGAGTSNITSVGSDDIFVLKLSPSGDVQASTAPAAPTLNSVTAGDRRVTISFTAGANNGAAITDYEYSLNGGAYTSAGTTSSPFTITGLSGRTAYSVTIKARNSAGLSTASSSLSATTTDSSLDASEAAAEAARVAAAAEAARVAAAAEAAAQAEAARGANEQRQMGDLSSVLPLINELIKEIEDGLKSTSAPKKKSSTSKTKQSSQAKPEKKTNSEPLTIPIPPATEPEAQSQVGELVTVSHKVGFGLSASWINSSNIKELRGFIAGVEESFEVERIVIQGYAQPTKIGLPDIDIARAKAVKKLLIKDGLNYPIVVEGMGQAESKKGDLSRLAVVTVEGKLKNQN